jgi:hypothetical protein
MLKETTIAKIDNYLHLLDVWREQTALDMKVYHAQEVKYKIQKMREDVSHHQDVLVNMKSNFHTMKTTVLNVKLVTGHMKCQILREQLVFQDQRLNVIALAEDH